MFSTAEEIFGGTLKKEAFLHVIHTLQKKAEKL